MLNARIAVLGEQTAVCLEAVFSLKNMAQVSIYSWQLADERTPLQLVDEWTPLFEELIFGRKAFFLICLGLKV